MGKVFLLDCTLRDGGYINDWMFGSAAIRDMIRKLSQTGVEYIEIGFMRNVTYNPDQTLFPDIETMTPLIAEKQAGVQYVAMIDMGDPVPAERLSPRTEETVDGIRVIFKKDKMQEGFRYCQAVKALGYQVFANFVSTDAYSDTEFVEAIRLFNTIRPTGMTVVDTFGAIKKKQLMRLLMLADNNMDPDILLCYHAHNNLQQAMTNAEAMVEMNLRRDILIDACVFGMGRGAGNLNLELFAEYMNENYGTSYVIQPMLEIMDEHLTDFYRTRFWGYSLPLYLSASLGFHPNYAIYFAEKNTLPIKQFYDLLKTIPQENKYVFKKEAAEKCYREFFRNYTDDTEVLQTLAAELQGRDVILIAPGKSILKYQQQIQQARTENSAVILINFYNPTFDPDYVFLSNMRRIRKPVPVGKAKIIAASNIAREIPGDYVINFLSYTGDESELFDNSGLMMLRLLMKLGISKVRIAGMDGYSANFGENYFNSSFEADHLSVAEVRNSKIKHELEPIRRQLDIEFMTPSKYAE